MKMYLKIKNENKQVAFLVFLLFFYCLFPFCAQALQTRLMNSKDYLHSQLVFVGQVLNPSENNSTEFLILEAIKGDIKAGQKIKLKFMSPKSPPSNPPYLLFQETTLELPPSFRASETFLLFLSQNKAGEVMLSGGLEQGLFYVREQNGERFVYNLLGNQNIIQSSDLSLKLKENIILDMQKRGNGMLKLSDFKKILGY